VDKDVGKLEISVDKYLLKEKSSAEIGFSLWRKLFSTHLIIW
jgi:hypothetical protein